jgi:hypothetical protein
LKSVVVASWVTENERYGAHVFGPFNTFEVSSSSLGMLAFSIEDTLAKVFGIHDPAAIEWVWLGRILDRSEAHVIECLAA